MRRSPAAPLALALLLVGAARAGAQPVNTDADGLALQGHDPVAYFTMGHAMPGSPTVTATHDGATYRFATAAHRALFLQEPARYLPQYGGYCAFGVSGGYKVRIDPQAFTVHDGKLYLNYDQRVQARWSRDIPGYLAKSERNWGGLKDKPRRDTPGA
jgi:hypothetical protein